MILIKNGIKIKNGSGIMKYNIKLSKGKININGKEYDIPQDVISQKQELLDILKVVR